MGENEPWEGKKVLKAEEFRKILRISPNKFKELLDVGNLPKPLPFGEKCRRWSAFDVDKYLKRL